MSIMFFSALSTIWSMNNGEKIKFLRNEIISHASYTPFSLYAYCNPEAFND